MGDFADDLKPLIAAAVAFGAAVEIGELQMDTAKALEAAAYEFYRKRKATILKQRSEGNGEK